MPFDEKLETPSAFGRAGCDWAVCLVGCEEREWGICEVVHVGDMAVRVILL